MVKLIPKLSVVIPTRNESLNVLPLLERLKQTLKGISSEIIFVDDSDDETANIIFHLMKSHRNKDFSVCLLPGAGSLAKSVVLGLTKARAQYIGVMDADFQHPPEQLRELYLHAKRCNADVAIGTRYKKGGAANGLNGIYRQVISRSVTGFVKAIFWRKIGRLSDPLSGFFVLRRSILKDAQLHPLGYKILLEVLVRCRWNNVVEAPYRFAARNNGESKANLKQGLLLVRQIGRITDLPRKGVFAFVGILSLLLGTASFVGLLALHIPNQLAYIMQAVISIESNFVLSTQFTWRDRAMHWRKAWRRFHLARIGTVIFNQLLFVCLTTTGISPFVAYVIGVGLSLFINYVTGDRFVFTDRKHNHSRQKQPKNYSTRSRIFVVPELSGTD